MYRSICLAQNGLSELFSKSKKTRDIGMGGEVGVGLGGVRGKSQEVMMIKIH